MPRKVTEKIVKGQMEIVHLSVENVVDEYFLWKEASECLKNRRKSKCYLDTVSRQMDEFGVHIKLYFRRF